MTGDSYWSRENPATSGVAFVDEVMVKVGDKLGNVEKWDSSSTIRGLRLFALLDGLLLILAGVVREQDGI